MAFQLTPLRIPSLSTDYSAENSAAQGLAEWASNIAPNLRKQQLEEKKRQAYGLLGQDLKAGKFQDAAAKAFALGDLSAGAAIYGLGQKAAERDQTNSILKQWGTGEPTASSAGLGGNATPPLGASVNNSAAVPSPGDPSLPAGMRNNNPGNIKFVGQKIPGIVGPSKNTDQGDPQAVFDTPESGMSAAYDLALRKYQGGKRTAADLIAGNMGWTPGNTGAAANIARSMGVSPDEDLRLEDPARAQAFMRALLLQEHGQASRAYSDEMIASAVRGRGQPAPQADQAPHQGGSAQVAQGAQAPALGGAVASMPGDDPIKLRQESAIYERTNPEAARQLRARADAASGPVQVAQAPAQPGAPVSDATDPRAGQQPSTGAPAQGYFIPGQGAQSSVESDPKVKLWQDRFDQATATGNEKLSKIAEKKLEIATKNAERRYNEGKAPESVREWQ